MDRVPRLCLTLQRVSIIVGATCSMVLASIRSSGGPYTTSRHRHRCCLSIPDLKSGRGLVWVIYLQHGETERQDFAWTSHQTSGFSLDSSY
ncbi:hypothetical protein RRG08_055320 [Elysia crispata]|uniref:Uncharacterized protein n=1 Tax=Elysia crispata TaxID=231223 RepID=A0AAE1AQF5_9GAST|nr:hypothetical protein RRG08_055320 [Elysia crispata]